MTRLTPYLLGGTALFASIALFGILAAPLWQGGVYLADDLGAFHLPLRHFYARALATGDSFLWMPDILCGFYLHGEGQAGLYHPLHLSLYGLLPLETAFNLELLLTYPFCLAGCWLFLRRLEVGPVAALVGALCFAFGSFNVTHYLHPNYVAVVAHLPWLLWGTDHIMRGKRPGSRAGGAMVVGLGMGSLLCLGAPQASILIPLVLAPFLAWTMAERPPQGGRRLLFVAAALSLGALCGAVQVLPTWEALSLSYRADPSGSFVAEGALHPAELAQLLAPFFSGARWVGEPSLPHEMAIYAGAWPLVAALWLLARRGALSPGHRRMLWGSLGLAILAFGLALGPHTPVHQLVHLLPGVGLFRFPVRFVVVAQLALSVMAALAFADILRVAARGGQTGGRTWLVLAAPAGALALLALALTEHPLHPLMLVGVGATSLMATCVLAGRRHPWTLAVLIVLVALDLGIYGLTFVEGPRPLATVLAHHPPPPRPPDGTRIHYSHNQLALAGYKSTKGYVALRPKRQLGGLVRFARVSVNAPLLRIAGVSWLKVPPGPGVPPHLAGADDWLPLRDPLPRVRLVSRARVSADPGTDLATIDPDRVALVETPLTLPAGPTGEAELVKDRPGHLEIRVAAPNTRLLVVSESYHPGWKATADGRLLPVIRVYGDFMGCVVGPEHKVVILEFAPRDVQLGRWLTLMGLAGLLLLGGVTLLRGRRDRPPHGSDHPVSS